MHEPAFVALSRFVIANDKREEVCDAFRARAHLVDGADGFQRMEVLSPADTPAEIWLLTWWNDEACFKSWHHGHTYKAAHEGIPKGLKLVPKSWELRFFEKISD